MHGCNPANPHLGAKPSYKKYEKVNICEEQLRFNFDEVIDLQHGIQIQVLTTHWTK